MNEDIYMKRLKKCLFMEFKNQEKNGVYGYTQITFGYNSNRIEGSALTEKQTALMFEKGILHKDDTDEIFMTKDIEEMDGHFKMFYYTMMNVEKPLEEEFIKGMHKNLKEGVFEDRANGYAIGDWKNRANMVGDIQVALPQEVPEKIHNLIEEYNKSDEASIYKIAEFHAKFENIHPFQDGNGRVGRMIILKQCLDNNIVPVIIRDDNKAEYYRCLNSAQHENDYSGLVKYFQTEQKYYMDSTEKMLFA